MKKKIVLSENDITNAVREVLEEANYYNNRVFRQLFTGNFTKPGQKAYYVCQKTYVQALMSNGFGSIGRKRMGQNLGNAREGVAGAGWYIMLNRPDPQTFPTYSYGDQCITVTLNEQFPILEMSIGPIAFVPFDKSDAIVATGVSSIKDGDTKQPMGANDGGNDWTSTATRPVSLEESVKRALSKAIKKMLNESKR